MNWAKFKELTVNDLGVIKEYREQPSGRKVASFLQSHFGPIIKLENSPRLWSLVLKSQSPFMVLGLELENGLDPLGVIN